MGTSRGLHSLRGGNNSAALISQPSLDHRASSKGRGKSAYSLHVPDFALVGIEAISRATAKGSCIRHDQFHGFDRHGFSKAGMRIDARKF